MRLFWSKKTGKTHEGGGGGNVRNLMKKFGRMANETYQGHVWLCYDEWEIVKQTNGREPPKETLCRTNQEHFKG